MRVFQCLLVSNLLSATVVAYKDLAPQQLAFRYHTVSAADRQGYRRLIPLQEPNIRPEVLDIVDTATDRSSLQPGYLFLAPFPNPGDPRRGPQIFDQDGVCTSSVYR